MFLRKRGFTFLSSSPTQGTALDLPGIEAGGGHIPSAHLARPGYMELSPTSQHDPVNQTRAEMASERG